MEQFIIIILFIGSLLITLATARGLLALLLHLMTLSGQSDRVAPPHSDTPARL